MATSIIEICNNALLDLGEAPITSLRDDAKAARLCNQRWPAVRDAVLRAHPWNCCMTQAELAAGTDAPLWRWGRGYRLPSDFLRIVAVADASGRDVDDWEVQGGLVLCDAQAPLRIAYVRREEDPRRYDALLSDALSARLCAVLAYPLSGSTSLAQAWWELYREKLTEARGVDAREGVPDAASPTNWLAAKLGSGRSGGAR